MSAARERTPAERLTALEESLVGILRSVSAVLIEVTSLRDALEGPPVDPPPPAAVAAAGSSAVVAAGVAEEPPVGGDTWVLAGDSPAAHQPHEAASTSGGLAPARNRRWLVTAGSAAGLYTTAAAARTAAWDSGQRPSSVEGVPSVAAAVARWRDIAGAGVELPRRY